MRTRQYDSYSRQFRLSGFLNPHLGGPTSWATHLIPAGTSSEDFNRQQASKINYAAVRPFETLDLQSVNHWNITQQTKDWLTELGHGFTYGNYTHLIPDFEGDGQIFSLIGLHKYRHTDEWEGYAVWSAIDQETSLEAFLELVKGIYRHRKFAASQFYDTWRLWYVLKTSWKAIDPARRAFDIYVPDEAWVKEHATFGPERMF
jgi:hypothetical protein